VKTAALDRLETLNPHAQTRLNSHTSGPEPLIRAELFGTQRFEEHGRSLAQAQTISASKSWGESLSFFPRVQDNIRALRQAYDYIATTSLSGQYVTPAAEWLLDNFHLVEAQLQQIHEGVPRRYYADLPKLTDRPLSGLPRVYGIAWAYVAHTDSVLDPALFTAFLHAYQEVNQLSLGELWALPTTLRVVLLENLRRVADHIAEGKAARELAHAVWDAHGALSENDLNDLLAGMRARDLERGFLTQLWQRIPDQPSDASAMLVFWINQHCPNGQALIAEGQSAQVATNLTISNIINSLRLIGQIEWRELIEPVSSALQVLQRLPSFAPESEGTRQQITQAMEKLARDTQQTELAVAEAVVKQAQASTPSVQGTAAYHLIGPGRDALLESLAKNDALGRKRVTLRLSPAWRLPIYLMALVLGTLSLLALTNRPLHAWSDWSLAHWVALALMAWPASEAVAAVIHRVIAESTRITPMPRLDFASGIPPEHRVLVVMPCMLTSPASIKVLAERLRLHWLASLEENAQFALLSDWADADQASLPTDTALLKEALAQITALNRAYPSADGQVPRFLVIHRGRKWCSTEGKWIGWERKRGKLEALVRLIAAGEKPDDGAFYFADGMALGSGIQYVVTLDSDTGLPPTALRELVSIAAHPLNTPHVDVASRRVTAGYGILQPRVVTPLPQLEECSPFHALFAGQCGIDPYSNGTSDVYQDLFGMGSFTGKGLLNVKALHAVLDQRFADESVLSHDLLEGSISRCAFVSDVVLVEDHPHHSGVDDSRQHRWARGDWQLLPLMLRASHYGIDSLGLWKMLDNLRRSLVVPASLALLLWVIFTDAIPLSKALAMVLAAFLAGPLLGALAGLVPTRRGIVLRHFFHVGMSQFWRSFGAAAWQFTQLVHKSVLQLDAIARALWRMGVSRKHLLQWTTAAQAQAAAKYTLITFIRKQAVTSLACVVLAALAWLVSPHPLAALMFAIWAVAPLFAWWVSLPAELPKSQRLDADERSYLSGIAHDTWRFFEHCITPQDNHLPPDNLQIDGEPTLAHRTSPTNIGLYLLAVTCARQFGWISTADVVARLQATLATIAKMPKYDGHLFNWYQTETLAVLQPAYVSTVDSGNLAGHLLAVSGAMGSLARKADTTKIEKQQLEAIAAQCMQLCMGMNFSSLYNPKRHLFHIGLRVNDHTLDASYYDLLASESRLASFVAIAKGDVPRRHWMALSRSFLSSGITPGLKSWSGSMFEYLMPSLVMQEPANGLLYSSSLVGVMEQQLFGDAQGLPWGVSESAYFAQDHSLAYQYSPFGVPRLALRRTPASERVVAPYASLMATMLSPKPAIANLRRMEGLNARGEYGFMDAIDFTAARQPHLEKFSVVKNYMAHHQGMALVALCNVLCGQAPQRWFAQTPLVAAYDTLLHERCPRQIISSANPRTAPGADDSLPNSAFQSRSINPLAPGWQPTHLLSNGRYSVALRPNGAGVSRWQKNNQRINVSRWRDDLARDEYGSFIYLKTDGNPACSVTAHPAPHPQWRYSCCLMADRVQFDATTRHMQATTTVLVSPEDDTELRTVVITNLLDVAVTCDVVSCFEVVLADARADEAHPAFSNLFIDTAWHAPWRALLLNRRPRLQGDPAISAAHFLAEADADILALDCITDRRAFLGRNRSRGQPAMARDQSTGSDTTPANGLDPVACLRVKVRIAAGGVARLSFATTVATDATELAGRIDQYLQPMHLERAARMAATLAQVRLRDLGLDADENAALQDLTTALMYSSPRANANANSNVISARTLIDQKQLWRLGISGDKPILLVRIHASEGLGLIQSLLRAQPWWSFGALATDVVVLNSEENSYLSPLQHEIVAQRDRLNQKVQHSFPPTISAGFYLLRDHEVSPTEKATLLAMARVVFVADGRPIEVQVADLKASWLVPGKSQTAVPQQPTLPANRTITTPVGKFDRHSGEFQFDISPTQRPARPWVNVIANASFGFQVSETGSGYTWAVNSRQHQITPWRNDPVEDPSHEHYLLQDIQTGQFLGLTPGHQRAAISASPDHRVRHGQGYSVFESTHEQLDTQTTFFADLDAAVKLVHVQLRNNGRAPRALRALAMAEWQMGASHAERRTVLAWNPPGTAAVMAQQRQSRAGFGGSTAFLALAGMPGVVQWTCDRHEFFDVTGQINWPNTLGQRSGGGLDACGALASSFSLGPGEVFSFSFVLGHAPDATQAEQLAIAWLHQDVPQALKNAKTFWGNLQGQVTVSTPDPLFDALINRWLLYQTLTSRLWSKAGFYQAGGAFGFRDQLQDSMAFAVVAPERLRAQIVLNASRQFAEGDVQHWWHAPGGEGVRTHFSDDLLWLPYACAHYVDVTGDFALLDEQVAFLQDAAIPAGAEDAYYAPDISDDKASVYEHCARAIDRSLATGTHGLPLMGTGDWNDGMNRVGHEGKGESVWLAWFLCRVVQDFAPLAASRGDTQRADAWLSARQGWIQALHSHGWDGEWFRRAFFDNGAPLGSSSNDECRIDLIAQAWSVLSGASTEPFMQSAMQSMTQQLIDDDTGLLHLLAPPFEKSANNPGYIQAYPPGVRENGGQYNHAAVWAMMAQAQTGDAQGAWESFKAISPAHRSQHPTRGPLYELEPYVTAGDIYGASPYTGRGGWSWYTGSAAWLYRAALENLLGLKIRQGELSITPCVPEDWPAFEVVCQQ
jgi:cyclic beta-1,2-glucan synthetase